MRSVHAASQEETAKQDDFLLFLTEKHQIREHFVVPMASIKGPLYFPKNSMYSKAKHKSAQETKGRKEGNIRADV